MANITHEQLIEYDAKIKEYIDEVVNNKVASYEQQIQELNQTIADLQSNSSNDVIHISDISIEPMEPDASYSIATTPMLRSLSAPILTSPVRSIRPTTIVVEEDIQEDYIVYDRIIYPNEYKEYKNIVVTTDDRSNRVFFNMWRTFDDRELADKTISIVWINAEGYKGETECVDVEIVGEDRLTFAWNIPYAATRTAGTIKYAIRITATDYIWNTLPADIECVQGLIDDNWDRIPDAEDHIKPKEYLSFCQISYDGSGHITASEDMTELQVAALNSGITAKSVEIITNLQEDVEGLQAQIDQIVVASAVEYQVAPEVAQARVSVDGTTYDNLKARIDATEDVTITNGEELEHTNNILDTFINGGDDVVVNEVTNVSTKLSYTFVKGRQYSFTNYTSGAVNLKVYDTEDTETIITTSLAADSTYFFKANDNYVAFSSWAQQNGTAVLSATDDGFYNDLEDLRNGSAIANIYEFCQKTGKVFNVTKEGNGVKFTTNRNIPVGNYGTYIYIPIETLSIKSIEFDIEANEGSPQIFISKNGGVTHIKSIINEANVTFNKRHIVFDIPSENIADGDDTTFVVWNATGAHVDGWFTISNLIWKRDTNSNSIDVISSALDCYMNGEEALTINVTSNVSVRMDYMLVKGRTYAYTNYTEGAVNLKAYDTTNVATTINASLASGNTYVFTCQSNFVAISVWGTESGTCTLCPADQGMYTELENIKEYGALADISEFFIKTGKVFNITKVGNGAKFTTNRDVPTGNMGIYISIPVATLSIKSVEFDIESNGGSPQIFISKNGGVTHISKIINDANITFDKKHIAFDLSEDNIADGDDCTFVVWNATGALQDGWFIISNLVWKRNTMYNKVENLNAADIPINNKLIYNMYDAERWNRGTIVKNNNNIVYTAVDNQNGGVETPEITHTSRGFLSFEFEIASDYHSDLTVYLFGTDTSGSALYLPIETGVRSAGEYKYNIDLNHYVVYSALDLTKPVRTAVTTAKANNGESLTFNYFNTYDFTSDLDIDGSISDGINYINSAVNSLANRIDTMTASTKVMDENDNVYFLKVVNGQLTIVPAIANNILYIGNSLLLGFDTFGMAASDSHNDYYAYVNDYLTSKGATLNTDKLRGSDWESCTSYSAQNTWMQTYLLPKLNNSLELVIVQLGDNVNTAEKQAVFAQGAINLLTYIKQNAPLARIAWVGAWYTSPTRQQQMANACKECGASFIDISLLPDIEGNRNHIGGEWTDDQGNVHVIDNAGVASHPSSQGMRAIADAIIDVLF